jgi:hypothetical protein
MKLKAKKDDIVLQKWYYVGGSNLSGKHKPIHEINEGYKNEEAVM